MQVATAMTREEIQKLIEEAATRFALTHEPYEKEEVARLTVKLAELHNIEVLTSAVRRSQNDDIRTAEVNHALDFLESRANQKWPFAQFREAMYNGNGDRCQVLNALLNRIRLTLGVPEALP